MKLNRYSFFATSIVLFASNAVIASPWSNENVYMGPDYTVADTEALVNFLAATPWAQQTSTGVSLGTGYTVNNTLGSVAGQLQGLYATIDNSTNPIPSLPQYGLVLTDSAVTDPKTKVVVIGGTHAREQSGSHLLDGFLRKLVDGSSEMTSLLGAAEFYVYPQINPEGRYGYNLPNNPYSVQRDAPANIDEDFNRVWNNPVNNPQLADIQSIMLADTGGDVDYFFDFHARSYDRNELAGFGEGPKQIWITDGAQSDPFVANLQARDTEMEVQAFVTNPSATTMSSRVWAMTAAGLNAEYSYSAEVARDEAEAWYQPVGESYALALFDSIVPAAVTPFGTIQIDFNDHAAAPGAGWNEVDTLGSAVALSDSLGNATDVTVTITGDLDNSSTNDGQDSADLADPTLEPGARDYFFISGADDDGFIAIEGLDPSQQYLIEVVASRSSAGSISKASDYTANGLFADSSPSGDNFDTFSDGFVNGSVLVWDAVTPNASGQIVLTIDSQTSPQSNGYINALRITTVPEPATGLLLVLGGGVLLRRRRVPAWKSA